MSGFKDIFDDKIKIFLIDEKNVLSYNELVGYINKEEFNKDSFLINNYEGNKLVKTLNIYKIVVLKFLLDVLKPEITNKLIFNNNKNNINLLFSQLDLKALKHPEEYYKKILKDEVKKFKNTFNSVITSYIENNPEIKSISPEMYSNIYNECLSNSIFKKENSILSMNKNLGEFINKSLQNINENIEKLYEQNNFVDVSESQLVYIDLYAVEQIMNVLTTAEYISIYENEHKTIF